MKVSIAILLCSVLNMRLFSWFRFGPRFPPQSLWAKSSYRLQEGWPKRMGDYPAAESIVDRLKNNAYKVELKGEVSMRESCMDEELRAYAEQKKD